MDNNLRRTADKVCASLQNMSVSGGGRFASCMGEPSQDPYYNGLESICSGSPLNPYNPGGCTSQCMQNICKFAIVQCEYNNESCGDCAWTTTPDYKCSATRKYYPKQHDWHMMPRVHLCMSRIFEGGISTNPVRRGCQCNIPREGYNPFDCHGNVLEYIFLHEFGHACKPRLVLSTPNPMTDPSEGNADAIAKCLMRNFSW